MVETHLPKHRERYYPPTMTLSMFLGQVMSADGSCQGAVNELNVNRALVGLSPVSGGTGGYCSARLRLPQELVQVLAQETGKLLGVHTPAAWLWQGRHVKLVDGTTLSLPDSEDNQAHYPQHGNQAKGAGFPLARLVGVISLATGAVLTAAIGPYRGKGTGEHGLFRERDHLVNWSKPSRPSWMSPEECKGYPDRIEVREMKVRKKVLVTTLLKPGEASKNALGMETLKCKTATMCEKEMWVYFLAYNLIRLLMAEAALQAGALPRELSFKHTLQIWVAWSQRLFHA